MKRKNYTPGSSAAICSDHFSPDDFIHQFGRKILKKDVIPSVFNFPSHLVKKNFQKKKFLIVLSLFYSDVNATVAYRNSLIVNLQNQVLIFFESVFFCLSGKYFSAAIGGTCYFITETGSAIKLTGTPPKIKWSPNKINNFFFKRRKSDKSI